MMTTHPEAAMTREQALVPFDEVMRAFCDLHSAYGDRFFDKDGPRFQEAYEKADKLLGKWQRGELAAPSFEAAAKQHEKEARRYEATAQESDEREDEPSMTEGDCARFIAETHRSAAATIRALASAQQEPAPAADAEEVARKITDEIFLAEMAAERTLAHHELKQIITAALSRYAGDGVTNKRSEEALEDAAIQLQARARDLRELYDKFDLADEIVLIERELRARAAARAKSGEKGGTR